MNQLGKSQDIELSLGTFVTGKWYKRSYRILRKLGSGACGTVYLAERQGKQYALKLSRNGSSITTEVNVLKTFQKVQGKTLGPSLVDVDDWIQPGGGALSFYVMEYLKGKELITFIKQHGNEWIGVLVMQLLTDLEQLHDTGWVFGDLKTDNLIVTYPPARLRWIDVGGTTQIGRAIKEYTEFYDRGYWGMGSRKANPSYDLFALAMVVIQLYYPHRFEKGQDPEKTLIRKLHQVKELTAYQAILKNALYGKYNSSGAMRHDIQQVALKHPTSTTNFSRSPQVKKKFSSSAPQSRQQKNAPYRRGSKVWEGIGIGVMVGLFYMIYIVIQWL
ncbi:serine/threonine protein kinase [Pontibacillus litoralis]|nr:serine/threonine-protein kinase [Pontibacillus litoralis]